MLIVALLLHATHCSLATELARTDSAAPPPPAGPPAPTLHLSALRSSNGQALQEKSGPDQLPRKGSGPGDGESSKPGRAESWGCVKAKASANTRPAARSGEKQTHSSLVSGMQLYSVQQSCTVWYRSVCVYLSCRCHLNKCQRCSRYFKEHENVCYIWSQEVTSFCFHICS